MKKRIFTTVVLIALTVGLILCGNTFRASYLQKQEAYEDSEYQLRQLTQLAADLEQELAGLTLDTAQTQTAQAEELDRQSEKLAAQLEDLISQIAELRNYLTENEDAAAALEEELAYLQGVCDALEEGIQEVENYISGN